AQKGSTSPARNARRRRRGVSTVGGRSSMGPGETGWLIEALSFWPHRCPKRAALQAQNSPRADDVPLHLGDERRQALELLLAAQPLDQRHFHRLPVEAAREIEQEGLQQLTRRIE